MDRRQMFSGAAACAAASLSAPSISAARESYDLVLRGGRVIDPSRGWDGICDIAVLDGCIAAAGPKLAGAFRSTLDVSGKLVVPGLIDVHTHACQSKAMPARLVEDGVTGWIDAGSFGADQIEDGIAIAKSATQTCGVLINIGRAGAIEEGDTMDLARADVAAAKDAIRRNRGAVVGVKARLSANIAGANDFEVLRRAQEVASAFHLPVMIHMGQTATPLSKLLGLLKRGDIVTHMFAVPPHAILDDAGRILPEALAARRRGVWFDVGNGRRGHLRWDIVEAMMRMGFRPDSISTDGTITSRDNPGVVDLPNCMSKFLAYGMTVPEVVACATCNSARMFPVFNGRGTLGVGAPADITVLDLRSGDFAFLDNFGNAKPARQRLFPSATIIGGRLLAGPGGAVAP